VPHLNYFVQRESCLGCLGKSNLTTGPRVHKYKWQTWHAGLWLDNHEKTEKEANDERNRVPCGWKWSSWMLKKWVDVRRSQKVLEQLKQILYTVVWKTWPLRALPPPPTLHHLSMALFQTIASGFNANCLHRQY